MSWRDVPMPPQIAALEPGPHGYPVAYIAQRFGLKRPPRVDPILGMVADEDPDQPFDVPDLGHMSEERQRRCWEKKICQVCQRSVRKGTQWLTGGVGNGRLDRFGFREPYVCGSCLTYALQVCPGLVRGVRNHQLRVVRARSLVLGVERIGVGKFGEPTTRVYPIENPPENTIAFYYRAFVTDGDVLTPDEFLKAAA